MDKFGLIPSGNNVPFEAHLEHLDLQAREMVLDLRNFTKSLGANVIEEVRPHRIVYAKTLTFRTFLDIEPAGDRLIIEIKTARNLPPNAFEVRSKEDLEQVKMQIAQAYEKIR